MVTWSVVVGLGAWWCTLCLGTAGQLWRFLEEFPVLRGRLVALFALGNLDFAFALVSFSVCSGEWVLPVEYGVWILRDACATWFNSGYMFTGGFGQIFSIFYVVVNSNPEAFVLHSA